MRDLILILIMTTITIYICLAINKFNQRLFNRAPTKLKSAVIAFMSILIGCVIGLIIIPTSYIPDNSYTQLILAIFIFMVLGELEKIICNKLSGNWLNEYTLDNSFFPFWSLGFAVSLILKDLKPFIHSFLFG